MTTKKQHIKKTRRQKHYDSPGVVRDGQQNKMVRFRQGERKDIEVKYVDLSSPGVNIYDAGTISLMNGCIQGLDSSADRIGRKISVKNIVVRGSFANSVAQLGAANFFGGNDTIRMAIVLDKQTNGAVPAFSDIWNISAAVNAPFGMPTISNVDRFVVLYEKLYYISATSNTTTPFSVVLKCDIETRFNTGNAGNTGDVISGAIFITFCDQNNTATNQTTASWISRLTFTDA